MTITTRAAAMNAADNSPNTMHFGPHGPVGQVMLDFIVFAIYKHLEFCILSIGLVIY